MKKKIDKDMKFKTILQLCGVIPGIFMVIFGMISYFNYRFISITIVMGFFFLAFLINFRTYEIIKFVKKYFKK